MSALTHCYMWLATISRSISLTQTHCCCHTVEQQYIWKQEHLLVETTSQCCTRLQESLSSFKKDCTNMLHSTNTYATVWIWWCYRLLKLSEVWTTGTMCPTFVCMSKQIQSLLGVFCWCVDFFTPFFLLYLRVYVWSWALDVWRFSILCQISKAILSLKNAHCVSELP